MCIKLCKLFVGVFFWYNIWYSQIWGANQLLLYSSVGLSIIFFLLDLFSTSNNMSFERINPIVKMYIIFGVYSIVTGVIVSVDKEEFFSSVFTYFSFTMIVFEVWYISLRTNNNKWLLDYIYLLALLCAVTTIFYGKDYRTEVVVTTMGIYNNPNTLGVFMVFGIFTVLFQKESINNNFIIKYLSIFAFLYVILLTGSRKSLFAGIGLFLLWIVEYLIECNKDYLTPRTLFIITAILLSVIGAWIYIKEVYIGMSGYERLLLLFKEGGTSGRIQLMEMGVDYWKKSPIFGIGLDQFKVLNPYGYYSHSTYSEILSCTGIVGCLFFFIPLLKLIMISVKKSFQQGESVYKIRICLLMLIVELFLGIAQIFIYSVIHMVILFFIANVVYEEIDG